MSSPKRAIITGATAGIGLACAEVFAAAGWHLAITGRRMERLEQSKQALEATHRIEVHPLTFDVRDRAAVEAAFAQLPAEWHTPDLLINNAGLARGLAPFDEGAISDWEEMIDTNIKGLLYVSRLVGGWMRAAGAGHIINIGSTAGREVYPGGQVYCATKHAVDALSQGMRMDLMGSGVKVSEVKPGMVETEFSLVRFHGDAQRANDVYKGFTPLSGKDVADVVLWMASAPKHVNIADVLLMCLDQASATRVHKKS